MRTEFEVIIERKDGKQFRYIYLLENSCNGAISLEEAIDMAHCEYKREHRGIMISALRIEREEKGT